MADEAKQHAMDVEKDPSRSSRDNASDLEEKNGLQAHRTISRVPENPNYYEVGGLRTEGDDQDHSTENKKDARFILTILGCAIGLCASQIVSLLYLTVGTAIAVDLETNLFIWLLTASNLSGGALAPFVGPVADLIGRRSIFLYGGFGLSILGAILCSATPNAEGFIAGQVLIGIGSIIQDLMSLAVVAEMVPTNKRPIYVGVILLIIIPWAPGTFYANLLLDISWRWIGLVLAIWNLLGFVVLFVGYHPPPRVNARGLTKMDMIKRIDFVGGILITIGLLLIMVGLNIGGVGDGRYPYTDARTLVPLVLGFVIFIGAMLYEYFLAPYPLFPRRIVHAPRPFFCMMAVIFGAGINYVAMAVFAPIQIRAVYQADNVQTGIYTIPIGTCILGGAIVAAFLLHALKKWVNWVMFSFCVVQVVAIACLVVVDPFDISTLWAPLVLALIAVGGVLVPNQVIITTITPDDLLGSVAALTYGLRSQAQAVGLAIFYNQFQSMVVNLASAVNDDGSPAGLTEVFIQGGVVTTLLEQGASIEEITALGSGLMGAMTAMPYRAFAAMNPALNTPEAFDVVLPRVIDIFSQAFERVYYITIAFGAFAVIAALFMGNVYKYLDSHVAVKIN